jgi:ribosome biogenesis ATPase
MDDCGNFLETGQLVIVIAATNRLEAIDPALRRASRFDREIHFGIPSEAQRLQILKVLVRNVKTRGDLNLDLIAKRTPGYVGADLHSLVKEAGNTAIGRAIEATDQLNLPDLFVEMADFILALVKVQPSSKREGFSTIPDTTWQDVGGLEALREELHYSIVHAIEFPEKYLSLGITAAAGLLLYGPPGCGKTLLAKAVANESKANFIAVNGPELLNKYVGESEKAVRQVFQRARDSAPCIVFFDEIDSLCAKRGQDNAATERVVNQFLTELSGFEDRRQVFVIAATNRPDIIDPAMLRPGRLDKLLFVALPDETDRASILRTLTKKTPLSPEVDFTLIAHQTQGYTGADLASIVREAACFSLRSTSPPYIVTSAHFALAQAKLTPSVSPQQRLHYEILRSQLVPDRPSTS